MNYIDLFIILVLLFYAYSGFRHGFLRVFFDLFALISSFFIALLSYVSVADYIEKWFKIRQSFSVVAGFFISWLIAEMFFYLLIQLLYPKIPERIRNSPVNKYVGILPSFVKGLFIVSIFTATLATLPFSTNLKTQILDSKIGKPLAQKITFLDKTIDKIFAGAFQETINFVTIKPGSDERIDLDFQVTDLSVDEETEKKMLELVNEERMKNGLGVLTMDIKIVEVARAHSRDMFERRYFAHINPEGLSPFDRMENGGVKFLVAGENLALAPNVEMAHKGLMDSQSHRENILSPEFKKAGIGVIDGGAYGKMFTQNFTD